MRSAPTIDRLRLRPARGNGPLIASVMISTGMPSRASSQAVRRAPWRKGRVSQAMTRTAPCPPRPRRERRRARCRSPRSRAPRRCNASGPCETPASSSAPNRPMRRQASMSSAAIASASATRARSISSGADPRSARLEAPCHPLQRGEEVHGGGPRRGEEVPRGLEPFLGRRRASAAHREGRAVGGRDADRGCAAHRHVADRDGDLGRVSSSSQTSRGRQQALIEEPEHRALAIEGHGRRSVALTADAGFRTTRADAAAGAGRRPPSCAPPGGRAIGMDAPDPAMHRSPRARPPCARVGRSAAIHAGSKRSRSIWIMSGKSCW